MVREADRTGEPVLVLAGGSNVVVADEGFPGVVAQVQTRGVTRDSGRLVVEAGEPWDELVATTVEEGLAGFECLSGIPGSTGATPIQNVGAYGQEVSSTVTGVRVLDRRSGRGRGPLARAVRLRLPVERLQVLRRPPGPVGLVRARAEPDLSEPIRYPELARALGLELGARAPLADVRDAVLGLRRGKGMVVDPGDPDSVSAGIVLHQPDPPAGRVGRGGPAAPGHRRPRSPRPMAA